MASYLESCVITTPEIIAQQKLIPKLTMASLTGIPPLTCSAFIHSS